MASYDDYYNQIKQLTAAERQAAKDKSNQIYASQATAAQDQFNAQIRETTSSYDDNYRQARIQKAINARQIAENMANMGLTDSGLNRTQMTANQLSYGNSLYRLNVTKQKAVDALALALRNSLAGVEQNRLQAEAGIDQQYDKYASDAAADMYKADMEAAAAAAKAYSSSSRSGSVKASGSGGSGTLYDYAGTTADGRKIFYDQNRKEKIVDAGVNPYGVSDSETRASAKFYGTFKNGYQPKGVVVDGVDYGVVTASGQKYDYAGREQNIWYTGKDEHNYWLWDGSIDQYVEVPESILLAKGLI